ncbi:hypothetical protein EJ02DRAFT_461738 [Clathrospora elynae]|uniref:Uncharacterized protein n=1 Tax=Clathrospora elynae TaxID=706981 RepID=A0A6A5T9Z7_9PLEO|nr:hypothetical protein EJ02DRAFT_461738 [Clathrospora elynae]
MSNLSNTPLGSSTSMTVTLQADGKNWKDWDKQINNCAAADCATPVLTPHMTLSVSTTELQRVHNHNKLINPLNEEARRLKTVNRKAHKRWIARNARLQNLILLSIEKSLTAIV